MPASRAIHRSSACAAVPRRGNALVALLVFLSLLVAAPAASAQTPSAACPEDDQLPLVTFPSTDSQFQLHGALFTPEGSGPFPAVLWNHGSERCPEGYLAGLALPFVRMGYVFFA